MSHLRVNVETVHRQAHRQFYRGLFEDELPKNGFLS